MSFSSRITPLLATLLLLAGNVVCANADQLRGTNSTNSTKGTDASREGVLLPSATLNGSGKPVDAFRSFMDIEFAPEDRGNSTHARKLASYTTDEYNMACFVNYERSIRGLQLLYWSADLLDEAQRWSSFMADTGSFYHRDPLDQNLDSGWWSLAENIANHWSVAYDGAHTSLMNSEGHRRNILNPDLNRIGLGVRQNGNGQYYVTEIFKQV
jgi:uncharacterized protein YkwD